MTAIAPAPPLLPAAGASRAAALACANFAANVAALAWTQAALVGDTKLPAGVEWVFARDGSLTMREDARWWSGCSVPRRAATRSLKTLDVGGGVACFPAPPHPAYLAETLALLRKNQAVLAVLPERESLSGFLACEDFSAAIVGHRLWFLVGEDWAAQLESLLRERGGLPIPRNFIRAPATGAARFDPMVDPAQAAMARVVSERLIAIEEMLARPIGGVLSIAQGDGRRVCIAAGSHFRLWDDAGLVLSQALDELSAIGNRVDLDDPAQSGPLAVARGAAGCEALVVANLGREDLPGIVRDEATWVTWLTQRRCPAFAAARSRDRLLVADEALLAAAREAGWPADRTGVAAWPAPALPAVDRLHAGVTLIADAPAPEPPEALKDFSSHRLLWEAIADDLAKDPFSVGADPRAYLARCARQAGIETADLPEAMLVNQLIIPAYQRGVARVLVGAKIAVRLVGSGWDSVAGLADSAVAAVTTRDEFLRTVASAAVLLDGWPGAAGHPLRSLGRPVLAAGGGGREAFVRQARRMLAGSDKQQPPRAGKIAALPVLGGALLSDILGI